MKLVKKYSNGLMGFIQQRDACQEQEQIFVSQALFQKEKKIGKILFFLFMRCFCKPERKKGGNAVAYDSQEGGQGIVIFYDIGEQESGKKQAGGLEAVVDAEDMPAFFLQCGLRLAAAYFRLFAGKIEQSGINAGQACD